MVEPEILILENVPALKDKKKPTRGTPTSSEPVSSFDGVRQSLLSRGYVFMDHIFCAHKMCHIPQRRLRLYMAGVKHRGRRHLELSEALGPRVQSCVEYIGRATCESVKGYSLSYFLVPNKSPDDVIDGWYPE